MTAINPDRYVLVMMNPHGRWMSPFKTFRTLADCVNAFATTKEESMAVYDADTNRWLYDTSFASFYPQSWAMMKTTVVNVWRNTNAD